MSKDKYIFMDCEMGGIGLHTSLLSAYFMVTDGDFNLISCLDLYLKPDDEVYHVTAQGMGVNKINLVSHDQMAVTYKQGSKLLYDFLSLHSDKGKIKLIPVGHGVRGDIEQVCDKLVSRGTWETFCSYRVLDTSSVAQFLKACGKFPDGVSGSLESLAEYFKLNVDGLGNKVEFHSASMDTFITRAVFLKLQDIIT